VLRSCIAIVTASEHQHGHQQGALRGEHRAAATLSRLVETASMHSMHPVAPPPPPPSGELLEPPPALQLDSVAAPAAADVKAEPTQHGDEGPTPRSSSRVRHSRRVSKAAAAASVRMCGVQGAVPRTWHMARISYMIVSSWSSCEVVTAQEEPDVPVKASTWTSLMDAVATTPAARRLSTSTSGRITCSASIAAAPALASWQMKCREHWLGATQTHGHCAFCPAGAKGSLLSVIPPDTPDEGPAAGNPRRQSTASSMMM
jgi:hypothetical protein